MKLFKDMVNFTSSLIPGSTRSMLKYNSPLRNAAKLLSLLSWKMTRAYRAVKLFKSTPVKKKKTFKMLQIPHTMAVTGKVEPFSY